MSSIVPKRLGRGRTAVASRFRLTTPLVRQRRGEPLRPATWEEALDRIRAEIESVQNR